MIFIGNRKKEGTVVREKRTDNNPAYLFIFIILAGWDGFRDKDVLVAKLHCYLSVVFSKQNSKNQKQVAYIKSKILKSKQGVADILIIYTECPVLNNSCQTKRSTHVCRLNNQ